MAGVYIDGAKSTAYATDGFVAMLARTPKAENGAKPMTAKKIKSVIPKRDGNKLVSFHAWPLLKICLAALAAGNPSQPTDCRIDLYLGDDAIGAVRYEIVNRDENTVEAVGAIMPMKIETPATDPAKLV